MVAHDSDLEPLAVVTTVRLIDESTADVWNRLLAEPQSWLGDGARIDAVAGGRVIHDEHRGVVREVEPFSRIVWEWCADGDPGWSVVEVSLEDLEGTTIVTIEERLMQWEFESYPAREAGGAGGPGVVAATGVR
jgi:uncharacterized protein YndB with AHSA1/START domain